MTSSPAATLPRLGALALVATLLSACTVVGDGLLSGDKVDYRNAPTKTQPLEVPPDLSQLARESRYQAQGGVISAAAAAAATPATAPGAAPSAAPATVALNALAGMRIDRDGQQRWLVVPQTPEQLWPQLRAFWEKNGFQLSTDSATTGIMETTWAENRAKIGPADAPRGIIARLMGAVSDTGERDRYRTRVERTATGAEVYITHRGIEEVYTSDRKDNTNWRVRPADPQLEAEFLSRLMVSLGAKDEPARTAVAVATPASAPAPAAAASGAARPASTATSIALSEPFDRAWRRVGLALDRSGFTVEDRDRAAGLYYVRYVDPKNAGKEEPGWWARLWGDKSNPQEALRYRVLVKAGGEKTNVSVQNSVGAAETGDNAQRIIGLLAGELR